MKKILQLMLLISINVAVYAQPAISNTILDNLNLTYYSKSASSTTLNQGAAGANATWNFASLVLTSNQDDVNGTMLTTVTTGPFSSSFPTSNFVLKASSILNPSASSEFYSYYNKTSTKVEQLAASSNSSIEFSYTNPSTLFVFPFSFGMSNTDTSQESGSSPVNTETITYDAYGTLITPYATYTNVIRIKRETVGSAYISYNWLKVNPYQDLASGESDPNGTFYFRFNVPPALVNDSFNQPKISVFPNPATNILNIQLPDNTTISKITITNLLGKKVIEQVSNNNTINIQNLANGMYVLEVVSGGNKMVSKFVKN